MRFPGQYYDQETGLHYNYYRYYDPNIGRFITSDRIGLTGGMNTYSYALQNPIMYYDPNGKEAASATATWWAAVAADTLVPEPTDLAWPKWAGYAIAGIGVGAYAIYEACSEEDEECRKEIEECKKLCRTARNDPDMWNIWGGSWWVCMTGCVSFGCQDSLDEGTDGS